MFKAIAVLLLALVASAVAFVAPGAVRAPAAALKAYVPDGLSPEEYAAIKAKAATAAEDRKKKFANKGFEDLSEWLIERDAKYPGQPGAGHRFAKVIDAEKAKPRASSFLN